MQPSTENNMTRTIPAMFAAASLAVLCAACASTGEQQAAHEQPVYRTGSNIAVHDGAPSRVQTADPTTIQDALRRTSGRPGPTTGN
jgi:tagatose-1,6-bisphosphate aldolase non-catalytic subunit AgaZ/GatZ